MNNKEFEEKLSRMYRGRVKMLERYINPKAVILFRCERCLTSFYAKPSLVVGTDETKHICGTGYSDSTGNRKKVVSNRGLSKNSKKDSNLEADLPQKIDEMIREGASAYTISSKLGINRDLADYYIKQLYKAPTTAEKQG